MGDGKSGLLLCHPLLWTSSTLLWFFALVACWFKVQWNKVNVSQSWFLNWCSSLLYIACAFFLYLKTCRGLLPPPPPPPLYFLVYFFYWLGTLHFRINLCIFGLNNLMCLVNALNTCNLRWTPQFEVFLNLFWIAFIHSNLQEWNEK